MITDDKVKELIQIFELEPEIVDCLNDLLASREREKKYETALKWISTTSKDEHAVNLAGQALTKEEG